jgi:hypothetical protein
MGKLLGVICSFAGTTAAARCAFAALFVATRLGLLSLLFSSTACSSAWWALAAAASTSSAALALRIHSSLL